MDYRNAFLWYQWDPTKWFIATCSYLGLATNLRVFPNNEIIKGALAMKLKSLKQVQDAVRWPVPPEQLPVVTWETYAALMTSSEVQEESKSRTLILISGFIHDVSTFLEEHPGGSKLLTSNSGLDMTASFFGDRADVRLKRLSMMRVGILAGGVERPAEHATPESQRLYIAER
ncbi:hypothetical protein V5O48_000608 [Marasmius crinis-equi]|uniref:Cytochrome b5 heme-binding domain-containing protein n=1 Tax=Marasmius crinis-equi TaxID=585013 RepID=A0ABR3G0X9_9AGAR